MKDEKLFTITTIMEEKDYHKFLYMATFFKSKLLIPVILAMSAIMAGIISYNESQFSFIKFFIMWIVLTLVSILTIILKVERKNKKRIKTDKTGIFNSKETLDFYEDFMVIKSEIFQGESKVNYSQFYEVLESKEYFFNYFNANQATLIRKKDMSDEELERLRQLYKKNIGKNFKRM